MLTLYVRRSKKIGPSKLDSPTESFLLESCPFDKLVSVEEIYSNYNKLISRDKEKPETSKVLFALLNNLVQKRFIIEVNGAKIEKLIESL